MHFFLNMLIDIFKEKILKTKIYTFIVYIYAMEFHELQGVPEYNYLLPSRQNGCKHLYELYKYRRCGMILHETATNQGTVEF